MNILLEPPNPKGTFSFRIPLKHIFGFCEDYNKILYGLKHTLTLTRDNDNNAIFRTAGVDAGKIRLDELSWYMPKVIPADKEKMEILKIIEKKEKLPIAYRMILRQPTSVRMRVKYFFKTRYNMKLKHVITQRKSH